MKNHLRQVIDCIIKNDIQEASKALSTYLTKKTHQLIHENVNTQEDNFIPDITYKCSNDQCEFTISFNKFIDEDFIIRVYEHPNVTAVEQSVGGIVDDKLIDKNTYWCKFTNVSNPEHFATLYTKALTDAAYEVVDEMEYSDVDDVNDMDDFVPNNRDADRAEAEWWDDRQSRR